MLSKSKEEENIDNVITEIYVEIGNIIAAVTKYSKAAIKAFVRTGVTKAITQALNNIVSTTNLLEVKLGDKQRSLTTLEEKLTLLRSEIGEIKNFKSARPNMHVEQVQSQNIAPKEEIEEAVEEEEKFNVSEADKLLIEGDCNFFGHGTPVDYTKAILSYEEAGKLHAGVAYSRLGNMYEKGIGVRVNLKKAIDCYYAGNSLEDAGCQYALGQLDEKGILNPGSQSKKQALDFYKKAADQNLAIAKTRLGYFYENGIEVSKDVQRANELYYEASNQNEPIAKNFLGLYFYRNAFYKLAYDFFSQSAEMGVARAINNLGMCYEYGYGTNKSIDMAMKCYIESAEKDYTYGMLNAGRCLLFNGVSSKAPENVSRGVFWLRSAIMKKPNLPEAHYYLGNAYEMGLGVEKDIASAFCFYKKAAKGNFVKAFKKCGDLLYTGFGNVKPDREEAFKWYHQASMIGDTEAFNCMGLMYEQGFGSNAPNIKEAESCYVKAHIYGSSDATVNLAVLALNVYL